MTQHNHEIIKVFIPVSTNIPIEMSPASPTIHKTPTKHEISNNALIKIQSQIDILKEEIEKTNTYCTEFKDDINKKLEHKSIREVLCERIVLLEKENNYLKNEIKNQQLIIQMLLSNENGKTQWKSSKSINPDLQDKPEIPTPINLTNRFESLHIAEENSGPENKNNDVHQKMPFQITKLDHVIVYDIYRNRDIDPLFIRNQLMMPIEDHR